MAENTDTCNIHLYRETANSISVAWTSGLGALLLGIWVWKNLMCLRLASISQGVCGSCSQTETFPSSTHGRHLKSRTVVLWNLSLIGSSIWPWRQACLSQAGDSFHNAGCLVVMAEENSDLSLPLKMCILQLNSSGLCCSKFSSNDPSPKPSLQTSLFHVSIVCCSCTHTDAGELYHTVCAASLLRCLLGSSEKGVLEQKSVLAAEDS